MGVITLQSSDLSPSHIWDYPPQGGNHLIMVTPRDIQIVKAVEDDAIEYHGWTHEDLWRNRVIAPWDAINAGLVAQLSERGKYVYELVMIDSIGATLHPLWRPLAPSPDHRWTRPGARSSIPR